MAARPTHEVPWFAWEPAVLEQQCFPVRGCRRLHGPRMLGQVALLATHCAVELALKPGAERHWGVALALVGSRVHSVPCLVWALGLYGCYAPSLAWAPALVAVPQGMVQHAPLPEAKQVPASPAAEIQDHGLQVHATPSGANRGACVNLCLQHIGGVSA